MNHAGTAIASCPGMKFVIFGLSISSSWGNGHATLWRGLCRSLARRGHEVIFYERDVPYYSARRDLSQLDGTIVRLYASWEDIRLEAKRELQAADAAIVTSYCPDSIAASRLVQESSRAAKIFYDLDTPVTFSRLDRGIAVEYLPPEGLGGFDLVLSYTGGKALSELQSRLGARRVAPLYGSVDPDAHFPTEPLERFRCDLSYLGTYAEDRQAAVERLFIEPAKQAYDMRFLLAGAQYPQSFPWRKNIFHMDHLDPAHHSAFYCSSRLTLNTTREAMARMGYCPSGRLFEAAACGAPIVSDSWEGLDRFFSYGSEILIAETAEDVLSALALSDRELLKISKQARERALTCHTADQRAEELEKAVENAVQPQGKWKPSFGAGESGESGRNRDFTPTVWGIIPAAGSGSRIQPLAFSKELLPVGSRIDEGTERPRAVSEFLVERMIAGGATKICFVISPGKSDILEYYGGKIGNADICYTVQPKPAGLCDALFRAIPLVHPEEQVRIGLPDTVWYPEDGFAKLSGERLSFLLFPVEKPQFFDAVRLDENEKVVEIEVKKAKPSTHWIWGAFGMPGRVFHDLHKLWFERDRKDEYMGTLVNAYIERGGEAMGIRAGQAYVDVGTLHGYREAIQVLAERGPDVFALPRPA